MIGEVCVDPGHITRGNPVGFAEFKVNCVLAPLEGLGSERSRGGFGVVEGEGDLLGEIFRAEDGGAEEDVFLEGGFLLIGLLKGLGVIKGLLGLWGIFFGAFFFPPFFGTDFTDYTDFFVWGK